MAINTRRKMIAARTLIFKLDEHIKYQSILLRVLALVFICLPRPQRRAAYASFSVPIVFSPGVTKQPIISGGNHEHEQR